MTAPGNVMMTVVRQMMNSGDAAGVFWDADDRPMNGGTIDLAGIHYE